MQRRLARRASSVVPMAQDRGDRVALLYRPVLVYRLTTASTLFRSGLHMPCRQVRAHRALARVRRRTAARLHDLRPRPSLRAAPANASSRLALVALVAQLLRVRRSLRAAIMPGPASAGALFPPIEPYRTSMLAVSPVHSLFVAQYGNPQVKPALFLHGGPGGGFDGHDARRFDPEAYHLVCFDQRGAGRSVPSSSLDDNTTQRLIEDCRRRLRRAKLIDAQAKRCASTCRSSNGSSSAARACSVEGDRLLHRRTRLAAT